MSIIKQTLQYGDQEIILETGGVARQADGAVVVKSGETFILVTVVGVRETGGEDRDFFPLTVNYMERSYAVGRIPGGFLKREGRPSVREVLTSRLMDRPLRPLFPKGFYNEVQVIATVMSLDPNHNPDVLSMIGASAALAVSGIPFNGPLAAARVGYKQGIFLLNPSPKQLKDSELDLVVAGTKQAVLMVESEARELSEEQMAQAILFGHQQMQAAIQAIEDLAKQADEAGAISDWNWQPKDQARQKQVEERVQTMAMDKISQAYDIPEKSQRQHQLSEVRQEVIQALCSEESDEAALLSDHVKEALYELEKCYIRQRILEGKTRIDGRDNDTVRPLNLMVRNLPRAHGSGLFTRGETMALVIVTLGTGRDARIIDDLSDEQREMFMLHYNFPPFSVGEVGFLSGPKRREIGHGSLAKRALLAVMPSEEEFPYVIRVVSEVLESNGSSSMATVCGASMALMDAGVPLKSAVAGIAMGLIKEGEKSVVLTDILGDEDHLGDMDFKVAGTLKGVTALQMDIKIEGIDEKILALALEKAKAARMHLLNAMQSVISEPRQDVSKYAPKFTEFNIAPEKIREVIGRGGSTIRELTEKTGTVIDITDDGNVKIAASDGASADHAKVLIEEIIQKGEEGSGGRGFGGARGARRGGPRGELRSEPLEPLEVGEVYEGKVVKLMDFGAFVSLKPGRDGFLHISEILPDKRVYNIYDELQEGQVVKVKIIEVDERNRVRISMKALAIDKNKA